MRNLKFNNSGKYLSGINFDKEKIEKQKELRRKANKLKTIKINWQNKISIDCSLLKKLSPEEAKEKFSMFENTKEYSAIYFFKIVSSHPREKIVKSLKRYKDKKLRSCPKIDLKRVTETNYLYCGSIKKDIRGRYIQHMGYGNKNTYALQLFYWAKRIGLILEFHYGFFNSKDDDCSQILESALAKKLKPLVGLISE